MNYKVLTSEVKKTGSSTTKNGAQRPWTLYVLTLEGTDIKPSGFEKVQPGDMVSLKAVENVKDGVTYTNHNYEKVDTGTTSQAQTASTGGEDKRVLKLLTVIAEQIGVDRQQLMDILQEK